MKALVLSGPWESTNIFLPHIRKLSCGLIHHDFMVVADDFGWGRSIPRWMSLAVARSPSHAHHLDGGVFVPSSKTVYKHCSAYCGHSAVHRDRDATPPVDRTYSVWVAFGVHGKWWWGPGAPMAFFQHHCAPSHTAACHPLWPHGMGIIAVSVAPTQLLW
jgi:hypothetical protein